MPVENEGEETLVAGIVDVDKTSVTSWRLLLGRNLESGAVCDVGKVVWHMDREVCCWVESTGWDSCTGVGRSFSGSVEAQGREEEDEKEEIGDAEEDGGVRE